MIQAFKDSQFFSMIYPSDEERILGLVKLKSYQLLAADLVKLSDESIVDYIRLFDMAENSLQFSLVEAKNLKSILYELEPDLVDLTPSIQMTDIFVTRAKSSSNPQNETSDSNALLHSLSKLSPTQRLDAITVRALNANKNELSETDFTELFSDAEWKNKARWIYDKKNNKSEFLSNLRDYDESSVNNLLSKLHFFSHSQSHDKEYAKLLNDGITIANNDNDYSYLQTILDYSPIPRVMDKKYLAEQLNTMLDFKKLVASRSVVEQTVIYHKLARYFGKLEQVDLAVLFYLKQILAAVPNLGFTHNLTVVGVRSLTLLLIKNKIISAEVTDSLRELNDYLNDCENKYNISLQELQIKNAWQVCSKVVFYNVSSASQVNSYLLGDLDRVGGLEYDLGDLLIAIKLYSSGECQGAVDSNFAHRTSEQNSLKFDGILDIGVVTWLYAQSKLMENHKADSRFTHNNFNELLFFIFQAKCDTAPSVKISLILTSKLLELKPYRSQAQLYVCSSNYLINFLGGTFPDPKEFSKAFRIYMNNAIRFSRTYKTRMHLKNTSFTMLLDLVLKNKTLCKEFHGQDMIMLSCLIIISGNKNARQNEWLSNMKYLALEQEAITDCMKLPAKIDSFFGLMTKIAPRWVRISKIENFLPIIKAINIYEILTLKNISPVITSVKNID